MVGASTVETTGNACCPASEAALKSTANITAVKLHSLVIGDQRRQHTHTICKLDFLFELSRGHALGHPRFWMAATKGSAPVARPTGMPARAASTQNSTWQRTEGTHTGPRSRLYPGLSICESPSAKYSPRHVCAL